MADLDDLSPVDHGDVRDIEDPDDAQPYDAEEATDEDDMGAAPDDDDDEDDADLEDDDDEAEDDTDFATIATGATVEEAKRKALQQLRKVVPLVADTDVEFVVVEEGSRGGFFGRGKAVARVEARVLPAAAPAALEGADEPGAEVLREFIQTTVQLMGINATVEAGDNGEVVRASISGEDLGLLIGRHGATIDALQYIAAIVVNGDRHVRRQVVVDAEGYRERRETSLTALADRTAHKVVRDAAAVTLKPMSAAERKVVHLALKDDPRVETVSEGQEPFRAVVVSPRREG
jgi:spoIIIJ-associated protein